MSPFKQLGQLAGLLTGLPKFKEEFERFQQRLPQITAEGDAGAGLVKARVNGKMEILAVQLSEEALRLNDREMLEDMIRAAVNQALERVRQQVSEEMGKMASNLGLPIGGMLGIPGFP
jgi:DNA-binding YbaB/EbfC family protein